MKPVKIADDIANESKKLNEDFWEDFWADKEQSRASDELMRFFTLNSKHMEQLSAFDELTMRCYLMADEIERLKRESKSEVVNMYIEKGARQRRQEVASKGATARNKKRREANERALQYFDEHPEEFEGMPKYKAAAHLVDMSEKDPGKFGGKLKHSSLEKLLSKKR